jgi:hypothetical protein
MNPEEEEAVYMVHTRELYVLQKTIYKIGRSHHIDSRIKQYPKGSKIMCIVNCKNSVICEKELIKIFKAKFKQRTDYGTEYFEGDKDLMIREIFNVIDKQNTIYKNANGGGSVVGSVVVGDGSDVVGSEVGSVVVEEGSDVVGSVVVGEGDGSVGEGDGGSVKKKDLIVKKDDLINKKKDLVVNNKDRTCPKCKYVFKFPHILKKHLRNAYHCLLNEEAIKFYFNTLNSIKCNKCNKVFSQLSSLYRHQRNIDCKSQS